MARTAESTTSTACKQQARVWLCSGVEGTYSEHEAEDHDERNHGDRYAHDERVAAIAGTVVFYLSRMRLLWPVITPSCRSLSRRHLPLLLSHALPLLNCACSRSVRFLFAQEHAGADCQCDRRNYDESHDDKRKHHAKPEVLIRLLLRAFSRCPDELRALFRHRVLGRQFGRLTSRSSGLSRSHLLLFLRHVRPPSSLPFRRADYNSIDEAFFEVIRTLTYRGMKQEPCLLYRMKSSMLPTW